MVLVALFMLLHFVKSNGYSKAAQKVEQHFDTLSDVIFEVASLDNTQIILISDFILPQQARICQQPTLKSKSKDKHIFSKRLLLS